MRTWTVIATFVAALMFGGTALAGANEDAARAAGHLADLDIAARDYVGKSPAFSDATRAKAFALIGSLRAQAATMSEAQFLFAIARVAGLADNGHDELGIGEGAWFPKLRLPIRMIWFADGLVVARAAPEAADLLGAHILAVEGKTPNELMDRLRPLQGGKDAYRRWQLNWMFHCPEALHELGVAAAPDRLRLRLALRDGRIVDRLLTARPASEFPPGRHPVRYWSKEPWAGESEKGWRAANVAEAPLYLQQPDAWFRMQDLPAIDALYVQFRTNYDEGDAKIAPFVAAVSQRLKTAPPKNLVLDLRFDIGGDNTQNRDLMREIAHAVPGRIYLLIGNYTFSAGIASAAELAHDGGDKVVVVGDEAADRTTWWSENHEGVCLPTSKLCLAMNTGLWDIVNGCAGNKACYSDQFDLRVKTLDPAIKAPLTSADWLANRDPALDAVAADLKRFR